MNSTSFTPLALRNDSAELIASCRAQTCRHTGMQLLSDGHQSNAFAAVAGERKVECVLQAHTKTHHRHATQKCSWPVNSSSFTPLALLECSFNDILQAQHSCCNTAHAQHGARGCFGCAVKGLLAYRRSTAHVVVSCIAGGVQAVWACCTSSAACAKMNMRLLIRLTAASEPYPIAVGRIEKALAPSLLHCCWFVHCCTFHCSALL